MADNKVAEYLGHIESANKIKQAASDEAVSKLTASIEAVFECINHVKAILPDYDVKKLSDFRKLAAKFGLTESAGDIKADKNKGRGKGRGKGKGTKNKSGISLSDDKAKEILDFIGDGEKSTKEIAAMMKTKNPSNALTFLRNNGKIVVARKDGLKKFWKKA